MLYGRNARIASAMISFILKTVMSLFDGEGKY